MKKKDSQQPNEGRARGRGHSHKSEQAQHQEVAQDRGHQGDERREAAPHTTAQRHTPHRTAPISTQTPHTYHTHHTHASPAARPKDGQQPHAHTPAPTARG